MDEGFVQNRGPDGTLRDQVTNTGGVRTYGTHTCILVDDGEHRGDDLYRFTFPLPYADPSTVQGALTCTCTDWRATGSHFRVGVYVKNVSFEPYLLVVDVLVVTENAEVIAVTIEGRVVDKRNLGL